MPTSALSAPGKVLLAGGYLVLDRAYTGLVFGLSARIHVVVQPVSVASGVHLSEIVVRSPQFRDAQWSYGYHLAPNQGGIRVTQLYGASSAHISANPFVETALNYALTYVSSLAGPATITPLQITILADNDYYSNPGQAIAHDGAATSQFLDFDVRLGDAHKTGLGSSAALVTAFTGAVLSHFLPKNAFDLTSADGRARLHNLAQAAHCAAQGKVGSGFDVAAAVYGTSIYRRFSPSLLASVGEPGTPDFAPQLRLTVEHLEKWDTEVSKGVATIPPGTKLVMCDVDCGSQTVSMVKKVLEWRKSDANGAKALWDELQAENEKLAANLAANAWDEIRKSFMTIRGLIRAMGQRSSVPIEPEEQTMLLDALSQVDGVCGGVVPGAGGYDAVALLIRDDDTTMAAVTDFLREWSEAKSSKVKLLNVSGEMEGARAEVDGLYFPWVQ